MKPGLVFFFLLGIRGLVFPVPVWLSLTIGQFSRIILFHSSSLGTAANGAALTLGWSWRHIPVQMCCREQTEVAGGESELSVTWLRLVLMKKGTLAAGVENAVSAPCAS